MPATAARRRRARVHERYAGVFKAYDAVSDFVAAAEQWTIAEAKRLRGLARRRLEIRGPPYATSASSTFAVIVRDDAGGRPRLRLGEPWDIAVTILALAASGHEKAAEHLASRALKHYALAGAERSAAIVYAALEAVKRGGTEKECRLSRGPRPTVTFASIGRAKAMYLEVFRAPGGTYAELRAVDNSSGVTLRALYNERGRRVRGSECTERRRHLCTDAEVFMDNTAVFAEKLARLVNTLECILSRKMK